MPNLPYEALADDAHWSELVVAGLSRVPAADATSAEIAAFLTDCRESLAHAGAARLKNDRLVSVLTVVHLKYPPGADAPITLRGVALVDTANPTNVLAVYELPSDVRLTSPDHYAEIALDIAAARCVDQG